MNKDGFAPDFQCATIGFVRDLICRGLRPPRVACGLERHVALVGRKAWLTKSEHKPRNAKNKSWNTARGKLDAPNMTQQKRNMDARSSLTKYQQL